MVHSLFCQRQSYLSWYVPLPALHSVFVSVSMLHNISGSVDLLPRREDMVSVNSDCFSGSAASSEERKKKHPKIYRITSMVAHQVAISIINLLLCWSIILKSQRFLLCRVWYFLSSHLIQKEIPWKLLLVFTKKFDS